VLVDVVGDVGYIEASITFTRDIQILRFEFFKHGIELGEESSNFSSELVIVGDVGLSLAETGTDGLLDPQNV